MNSNLRTLSPPENTICFDGVKEATGIVIF